MNLGGLQKLVFFLDIKIFKKCSHVTKKFSQKCKLILKILGTSADQRPFFNFLGNN